MIQKIKENYLKLKSIKNFEIIVALIIIAITLLIYFSVNENKKISSNSVKSEATESNETLERKLSDILSEIKGVGEVSVLITYNSLNIEEKSIETSSTNDNTSSLNQILSNQTNSKTNADNEVLGVIVVAEGGGDVRVKMNILSAVSTALDINPNSIQIFTRRDL
jgi:stage III sporulation protein AG